MAKVLICDDSGFMRDMITDYVESDGHDVCGVATNGTEALDLYLKLKPDVVTMDIVMQPDGVEAIQKIVERDKNAKILIVTVLEGSQRAVIDGIKAGAVGYVTKPLKKDRLLQEIDRVTAV